MLMNENGGLENMKLIFDTTTCSVVEREYFAKNGRKGFSVALNAEKLIRLHKDNSFRGVVSNATLLVVDGAGAKLWLKRNFGITSVKIDFPNYMFSVANRESLSVGVLGGNNEAAKENRKVLTTEWPEINFEFVESGYLDLDKVIALLKSRPPKVCFLALGSPKQEQFADYLSSKFPDIFFVCCGGALDVMAGRVVRAPRYIIESNFEWLYRLWKQPKRFRRYLGLAFFVVVTIFPERLIAWLDAINLDTSNNP